MKRLSRKGPPRNARTQLTTPTGSMPDEERFVQAYAQIQEPELRAYAHRLLDAFGQEQAHASSPTTQDPSLLLEPLTPQEQRVLRLLAEGASNQQIANQLVISLATARKHVSNILGKLRAANRTQAIARARAYALL
jgi:LuxR family transcriptional regulator, maltose regulon positive regulatory protein